MKYLAIFFTVMFFTNMAHSELCTSWGLTRSLSISYLETQCGVSASVASGASCSITKKGKYMCSVETSRSNSSPEPTEPCSVWGLTRELSVSYVPKKCGVSFNESRDKCVRTKAGKFKCTVLIDKNNSTAEAPSSSRFRTIWEPNNSSLSSLNGFRGHERINYDRSRDALKITQYPRDNRIAEYRSRDGLWVKGNKARMTVDMFIPPNFDSISGRLAIGIYGGNNPTAQYVSGGGENSHKVQDGFSVRINYSPNLTANVYAYNLNRPADQIFGTPKFMNRPMPTGEWFTMVLEVNLNTPGKADGDTTITMYDQSGKVIDSTTLDGMVFRNQSSWDHFGIILTEKTKGPGHINLPAPQTQSMYYSDYSLEIAD